MEGYGSLGIPGICQQRIGSQSCGRVVSDRHLDQFVEFEQLDHGVEFCDNLFRSADSAAITIFGNDSEFETNLRKSRQQAGIIRAKASGKTWGGRQPTSDEKLENTDDEAQRLHRP